MSDTALVRLEDVVVQYPIPGRGFARRRMTALSHAWLSIERGEAVGIVGESGCGKSTLARAILRLVRPTSGRVSWFGEDVGRLSAASLRRRRERMQIVFQDPLASLDPLMTTGDIVAEPLRVHRREMSRLERRRTVGQMLERVGLSADMASRYPHEFSGGQCQRIGIARAMVLQPDLLVCDEAVSALDVSVQAQIVNLLMEFKQSFGLAIVFVSHNLAVVRHLCDRVLVLYLGEMMEQGSADDLFCRPAHPYTRSLLAAVPVPDPDIQPQRLNAVPTGELPSPMAVPSGCPFRTRCAWSDARWAAEKPSWRELSPGHHVACHHVEQIR